MDQKLSKKRAPAKSTRRKPSISERSSALLDELAQSRLAIEAVSPEIDCGRFPAKRAVGQTLDVSADIFCDGHDVIDAALLVQRAGDKEWREYPLVHSVNDRWTGHTDPLEQVGRHHFTIIAWRDLFASWQKDFRKKLDAGQNVKLELVEGRELVASAHENSERAVKDRRRRLKRLLGEIDKLAKREDQEALIALLLGDETSDLMHAAGERTNLTRYHKTLDLWVDRQRAEFSAWYEMMPRSQSSVPGQHGTFDDVIEKLPYVRDLGFDVLYFTPIHPIGEVNRKGANNSLTARPGEPGSPYAIGSQLGGHEAIHPELGTEKDFSRLVKAAHEHGLEIALDFAIQCAPDHPWIKEHPEWFDWRPDGTIKYAENPPKKYEDIVNVHFYRHALPDLWYALRDIVLLWAGRGVRIFRVDNPHTKPFPFWEWMIREVQDNYPDVIFLSEAFTRPKVMKRLAKVGFSQSYSYFTWRNTKQELTEYLSELTQEECMEYMRVNFFANTPDINPVYLQTSGRAGFRIRLLLAATLAGNYGLYNGFEICEATPVPGKEEYLHSEKYEIKSWDFDREGHIKDDIRLVNRIRREHRAFQNFRHLAFYNAWNDQILYYARFTPDLEDFVLVAVNLDPHNVQEAHFEVPLWEFGLPDAAAIEVEDLVTGVGFTWRGKVQHMRLDPAVQPYHLWRLIPPQVSA